MKNNLLQISWILAAVLMLTTMSTLAAQEPGIIAGSVYDAATGNVLPKVKVTAQGPVTLEAVTNLDGVFRIEAPPGDLHRQIRVAKPPCG